MKNRTFGARVRHAIAGIVAALRHEKSFRVQGLIAIGVVPVLFLVRPQLIWWALVAIVVCLVLAAELLNTALEHLADIVQPRPDPRVKLAKDCAAGAVFVLSVGAVVVGLLALASTM